MIDVKDFPPEDFQKDDISTAMEWANERMKIVEKHGLQIEVLVWALRAMKDDNSISIEDAIEQGCSEWDV